MFQHNVCDKGITDSLPVTLIEARSFGNQWMILNGTSSCIIGGSEMLLDVHHCLCQFILNLVQVGDCWFYMLKTQYKMTLLIIHVPKGSHTIASRHHLRFNF
jgi:hypothetical protein